MSMAPRLTTPQAPARLPPPRVQRSIRATWAARPRTTPTSLSLRSTVVMSLTCLRLPQTLDSCLPLHCPTSAALFSFTTVFPKDTWDSCPPHQRQRDTWRLWTSWAKPSSSVRWTAMSLTSILTPRGLDFTLSRPTPWQWRDIFRWHQPPQLVPAAPQKLASSQC